MTTTDNTAEAAEIGSGAITPDAAPDSLDAVEAAASGETGGGTDAADAADGQDGGGQADRNREAARYRRRLRKAEVERDAIAAERDALAERLTAMQRRAAEQVAARVLEDGVDLWRDGFDIAEALDDDGNLSEAKVIEAAAALVDSHPHWRRQRPQAPSRNLFASGASNPGDLRQPSWAQVLQRSKP
ncbi:hypothetical protein [Mycolicibacterium elephantis]